MTKQEDVKVSALSQEVKALIKYAEENGVVFEWDRDTVWGMVLIHTHNLCRWLDLLEDSKEIKDKIDSLLRESERMEKRREKNPPSTRKLD